MKYIRIAPYNGSISWDNTIVIFPEIIDHFEMASRFKDCTIISAGFVQLNDNNVDGNVCYGKSVSLKLESHPNDTKLLRMQYWDSFMEHLK